MRFPSLRLLLAEATRTLLRFPFVLATAVLAAVTGIRAVDETAQQDVLLKVMLCAQLGIPLFFALSMLTEKRKWPPLPRFTLAVFGAAALVAYYFSLPSWISPAAATRFVQYNAGLHLLVAFVPFVRTNELNAFWQYNKSLFLRFLLAVLYSGVLYVGLAVALAALDQLFGLKIEDETYLKLWIAIAMIFNTWIFLGGVPKDLHALESEREYPKGLKVFTQYVLIPLVIVYLLILTAYLAKIVITQIWPSGWIGYLVSSVSAVGILSHLLVHPIREQSENRWVKTFSRWFYVCLFPSIIMLMMAIYKRVAQYGVTEPRYFLIILSLWLAAISLYFAFGRAKNIKIIPTTLCLLAFVTSLGPWGAFGIAERSQTKRLTRILVTNDLLVGGVLQPSSRETSFDDRKEISAILTYLLEKHGAGAVAGWLPDSAAPLDTLGDMTAALQRRHSIERARAIMGVMELEYVASWAALKTDRFHYQSDPAGHVLPVHDYDLFVKFKRTSEQDTLSLGEANYRMAYSAADKAVRLIRGGDAVLDVELLQLIDRVRELEPGSYSPSALPVEKMIVRAENQQAKLCLYVNHIVGDYNEGKVSIDYFTADCFIKLKE